MLVQRKNLEFLGFPSYEVDSLGVVWSWDSSLGDWEPLRLWPNGKPNPQGKFHQRAQLYCDRVRRFFAVHHLVLLAFVGPQPFPEAQARHLDDNPENNRLENLCWGTQEENMADLKRNGRFPSRKGERNPAAKLTEEQVAEIRRLYVPRSARRKAKPKAHGTGVPHNPDYLKYSRKKLAEMFGVSVATIDFIIDRPDERWEGVR